MAGCTPAAPMKLPIYLDYNATTPVDPRALARMLPFFSEDFGNAASRSHVFGWKAEAAVEAARERVAALIGARAREIVFTSGATESDNLAIVGVVEAAGRAQAHIVTQVTEHKAVLDTCKALERRGVAVTYLPVDEHGRVDPGAVAAALTDATLLVSIMLANNEVGTIQPVAEIGRICHERGVLFHCDAVQGVGKIPFDVERDHVDLASLSAHKLYGPKGIGALYLRRQDPRVRLAPQIVGGGHEGGLRSGTPNVPAVVGFGAAAELCVAEREAEATRVRDLRDRLHQGICAGVPEVTLNGHLEKRLPGTLNLSFAGLEGDALMMTMKDVAVSAGSACTSATLEPSYVLRALGRSDEQARGAIRFGLGRFTTAEEVNFVIEKVRAGATQLRQLRRAWHEPRPGGG
jgi:cysteine desulfurase